MMRSKLVYLLLSFVVADFGKSYGQIAGKVEVDHWSTLEQCQAAQNAPYYVPSIIGHQNLAKNETILGHPNGGCFELALPDRLGGRGWVRLPQGTKFVYGPGAVILRLAMSNNQVYSEAPLMHGAQLAQASPIDTNTLDLEMAGLADQLGKTLVAKGSKNVAVLDFTDMLGQPTALGRFLSEQLTVRLVETTNFSMVDQARIKQIIALQNLTADAILDTENTRKLRDLAGVDTILEGTVTDVDDGMKLTVKAVSTNSIQIIAAGWVTLKKTRSIQDFASQSMSTAKAPEMAEASTLGSANSSAHGGETPLAVKDIGPLRVILKSVVKAAPGDHQRSIHILLEFTNRGSQNPLIVAINGESPTRNSPAAGRLRSHVIDDDGATWDLFPSGLFGLGYVRAGVHGRQGSEAYSPNEVSRLLQLRDNLGRDSDDPTDGFYANADSCGEGGCNSTFNSGSGNTSTRKFFPFTGNTFISGSTTTIENGRSATVTMTFVPQAGAVDYGPLISFKIQSEIVMVVMDAGTRRSYSLQNLTFEVASEPAH